MTFNFLHSFHSTEFKYSQKQWFKDTQRRTNNSIWAGKRDDGELNLLINRKQPAEPNRVEETSCWTKQVRWWLWQEVRRIFLKWWTQHFQHHWSFNLELKDRFLITFCSRLLFPNRSTRGFNASCSGLDKSRRQRCASVRLIRVTQTLQSEQQRTADVNFHPHQTHAARASMYGSEVTQHTLHNAEGRHVCPCYETSNHTLNVSL